MLLSPVQAILCVCVYYHYTYNMLYLSGMLSTGGWDVDCFSETKHFTYLASKKMVEITCKIVVVVVALLFYVHGKHLRSCRDGQLT